MNQQIETADLLDSAADLIEREGWAQDTYGNSSGRCAVGALRHVGEGLDLPTFHVAWDRLRQTVIDLTAGKYDMTHCWNDAPERTKQEVLDALRLAAKNERILADGGEL